jgi:hypothetical protein
LRLRLALRAHDRFLLGEVGLICRGLLLLLVGLLLKGLRLFLRSSLIDRGIVSLISANAGTGRTDSGSD